MAITNQTLQKIKSAPLSSVIEGTGAKLKRVGREFLTHCIWHEDTNPSLTITDDKGFCFCHVCRGGGDAIDYVRQKYGLGMRDATQKVADIIGIQVETDDENPEETARKAQERKRTIQRLEKENESYISNLHHAKAGRIRQILKDRGLSKAAATEFGLGFAPTGPFQGRITIPIYNHRNELVGWSGRTTLDHPAKYKNSADSDVFSKRSLVFNESRAKEAARKTGFLIFVEGHLDVISLWQAGIKNVVAIQGTGAPDPLILQRLARNIKSFILCFDGDAGGHKAIEQFISTAGPMAMKGTVSINIASLPDGSDPDEYIRNGGDLHALTSNAPSWLDWVIDVWAAALDLSDTAAVMDVENKLHDLIDNLPSPALRAHYVNKAARVLSAEAREAAKIAEEWQARRNESIGCEWVPRTPEETRMFAERRMLRLYIHKPELREALSPLLAKVQHPPFLWLRERLEELEQFSASDLTPYSIAAVVALAEPHLVQKLRNVVKPNVRIDDSEGVIRHIHKILT